MPDTHSPAAKNIVLLSDGTGNSAAKLMRTNVWRMYEALDLTRPDQVAIYNNGVGTSSFKPLAVLGGAIGFGLKRNVLDLYMFACRNYVAASAGRESDRIYAFGFSRGAFTIRVLVGPDGGSRAGDWRPRTRARTARALGLPRVPADSSTPRVAW